MKPYTDKKLTENIFDRQFDVDLDNSELVWHRDKKTRFIKVLEGEGWKFQYDNETPKPISPGSVIHINKNSYHRLIKGNSNLTVRIFEIK